MKIKKLLILILVGSIFQMNAQKINKDGDGYYEVYETDLSIKETNQKVVEWIADNYKSAKNVIELQTESKIVLKGNFPLTFSIPNYKATYDVHKSLSFSFREGRYKIDLVPTKVTYNGEDMGNFFATQFITENIYSAEEFLNLSVKSATKSFISQGYSEKKTKNMIDKYVIPNSKTNYENYIKNKKVWEKTISSLFEDIKNYIDSEESW